MTRNHSLLSQTYLLCLLLGVLSAVGCATKGNIHAQDPAAEERPGALSPTQNRVYLAALEKLKEGEPAGAEDDLRSLAKAGSEHLGVWINLATAFYQNRKLDEAEEALARAKSIQPDLVEIYNLYGLIAVEQGEYQLAENHYLAAISLANDYPIAHYNLALLYDVFYQELAKAVHHYRRYLALTGSEDASTVSWVNQLDASLQRETRR